MDCGIGPRVSPKLTQLSPLVVVNYVNLTGDPDG